MRLYLSESTTIETREEIVDILEKGVGPERAARIYDRIDKGVADVVHFEVNGVTYCLERGTRNGR